MFIVDIERTIRWRTVVGAINQLWYAIFYFSIPFVVKMCTETAVQMSTRREWVVVHENPIESEVAPTDDKHDEIDENEWVIVGYDIFSSYRRIDISKKTVLLCVES